MLEQFTKKAFRKRLREICSFAFQNASNKFPRFDPRHSTQEEREAYRRAVWEGWKWAQHNILEELARISTFRTETQQTQKNARRNRDHKLDISTGNIIRSLDYQEATLRAVANSMIWTMYGLRRWIVRRLWVSSPPVPITSINPTTFQIAHDINQDPGFRSNLGRHHFISQNW